MSGSFEFQMICKFCCKILDRSIVDTGLRVIPSEFFFKVQEFSIGNVHCYVTSRFHERVNRKASEIIVFIF